MSDPERRGRRPTFDRDALVDAAVAVIDRDGLDGMSLRLVGAELGVTAMAAYRVVASKEELLALVPDRLVVGIGGDLASAADGIEALRAIAGGLDAVLAAHPHAAPLFDRPQVGPNMTLAATRCIDRLVDEGCPAGRAAGLLRATVALVVGLRVTGGASADETVGPMIDDAIEIWLNGVRAELALDR